MAKRTEMQMLQEDSAAEVRVAAKMALASETEALRARVDKLEKQVRLHSPLIFAAYLVIAMLALALLIWIGNNMADHMQGG